jgi:hypothetical protein
MQEIARWSGAIRLVRHLAIIALVLLAVGWHPRVARAAATLTITPASSPCTGQVILEGKGFAPGIRVGLVARQTPQRGDAFVEFATQTVAADGTFRMTAAMGTIVPTCQMETAGTVYTVYVITPPLADKTGTGPEETLATATVTVGAGTPGLPNTGSGGGAHLVGGAINAAALALGGLLMLVAGAAALAGRRSRQEPR